MLMSRRDNFAMSWGSQAISQIKRVARHLLRDASLHVALALLVLALSSASTGCAALITSQTFAPITLEEWLELPYAPVILWPEPDGFRLVGPTLKEGTSRVELYYAQEHASGGSASGDLYLYEADTPSVEDVLVRYHYDDSDESIRVERITAGLFGAQYPVELRRSAEDPNTGVLVFDVAGTYVICHWRNMTEDTVLRILEERATLVSKHAVGLVSSFDQRVEERRREAGASRQ